MKIKECWFSPDECASYQPEHIVWIILVLSEYQGDSWPEEPSSAIDVIGGRLFSGCTYFEQASMVRAELDVRLEKTGRHGELLRTQIIEGKQYTYEARRALQYCRGRARKAMPYRKWLWQRETRDAKSVCRC